MHSENYLKVCTTEHYFTHPTNPMSFLLPCESFNTEYIDSFQETTR